MSADVSGYYIGTHQGDDGIHYAILDAPRLYSDRLALSNAMDQAVRIEAVYEWLPKPGDIIAVSGRPPMTATGTEIVFIKKMDPEGTCLKVYIPSGSHGSLTEHILDEKYEEKFSVEKGSDADNPVLSFIRNHTTNDTPRLSKRLPKPGLSVPILHEVIDRPSIILNARGEGKHQTMMPGDSLKFEDGDCLPLPKIELDAAWKVIEKKYGRTEGIHGRER